jgi:hypothetical protein
MTLQMRRRQAARWPHPARGDHSRAAADDPRPQRRHRPRSPLQPARARRSFGLCTAPPAPCPSRWNPCVFLLACRRRLGLVVLIAPIPPAATARLPPARATPPSLRARGRHPGAASSTGAATALVPQPLHSHAAAITNAGFWVMLSGHGCGPWRWSGRVNCRPTGQAVATMSLRPRLSLRRGRQGCFKVVPAAVRASALAVPGVIQPGRAATRQAEPKAGQRV